MTERRREYMRAYWRAHKDKHNEYMRTYYARNKEAWIRAQNDYFRRNMERYRDDGLLLYETRLKHGLRQKDVAKMIGVTTPTISNWENGKVPVRWNAVCRVFPELIKEVLHE